MSKVCHEAHPQSRRERLVIYIISAMVNLGEFWHEVAHPWVRSTWTRIRDAAPKAAAVPEAYRLQMRDVEREYAEDLDTLTSLDPETRARIKPAIASAAVSHKLRQGWAAAVDDLIEDHYAVANTAFYGVVGLFAALFFSGQFVATPTKWCFAWTMVLVFFAQLPLQGVWRRLERISTRLEVLARLVVLSGLLALVYSSSRWRPAMDRWFQSAEPTRWLAKNLAKNHVQLAHVHLDVCILDASVVLACIGFFPLALRFAVAMVRKLSPSEPREILPCARVTIEFLEIAVALQELVEPALDEPVEPEPEEQSPEHGESDNCALRAAPKPTIAEAIAEVRGEFPMVRPYIVGIERQLLLERVERLAQFVEDQWRRAIHTGDRAADNSVDQLAVGIAAALRRWKPDMAIGGSKLHEMRRAFAVAVQNIAEGEWSLLAIEAPSRQSPGHRLIWFARRVAALSVVFGALYVVLTPPPGWQPHINGLVPVIWLGAGLLAVGLDPTLSDRFGLLSKVTTALPSGR
jgi:hypothetical protein